MPGAARALVGHITRWHLQPPTQSDVTESMLARLTEWKRQEDEAAAEHEARKAEAAEAALKASKSTAKLLAEQLKLRSLEMPSADQSQPQPSSASTIPLNGPGVLRAVISGLGSGTINGGQS